MKKYDILLKRLLTVLVLFSMALLGCSRQLLPAEADPYTVASPSAVDLLPHIELMSQTPTPNILLLPTVAITQTPTVQPTREPTFNPTQFAKVAEDFLNRIEDCRTPCVFGISAGETKIDDAIQIFRKFGYPLRKNQYPSGKEYLSTFFGIQKQNISVTIDIMEREMVVKNIDLGMMLPAYQEAPAPRTWQAFSPETILTHYGTPSQISFNLSFPTEEGFPQKTAWYDMIFEYKHLDLIIQYFHGWTIEDNLIKICPTNDQYTSISLYLGKDLEYPPYRGVPLENISPLTADQFTNLLTNDTEGKCFELSKDAFFTTK